MHSSSTFILTCLLSSGLAASTLGCASNGANATPYVVVHGSWQGASDWDDVASEMRSKGARVTVVELPAHGKDQTPLADASFEAYTAKVQAAVDEAAGPVILVGHSFGGMVISAVAEQRASKVQKLIYLGAFVPKDGDSVLALAATDKESHLGPAITLDEKAGTADVAADELEDIFCADCSASQLAGLKERYRVEPLAPLSTPVRLTTANWGKVSKYYVYTKNDHAISYGMQRSMTSKVPFEATAVLDTGHSPFVSNPSLVVSTLLGF